LRAPYVGRQRHSCGGPTPIGSSPEWIAALGIDARRLRYVLGGKSEDQLHVRDLDSGVDRVVARGPVGDQQVVGGIPGFNRAFLAGDWAILARYPRCDSREGIRDRRRTDGQRRCVALVHGDPERPHGHALSAALITSTRAR
jgi:hypothetical protein